jgi:hypothetical protein
LTLRSEKRNIVDPPNRQRFHHAQEGAQASAGGANFMSVMPPC